MMSDLVEHRRWQADTIEKHNPPVVGEWNWPQMLRDDADEIERLTEELAFQTACHEELRGHMKEADDRIEKLERVLVAAKKVIAIDAITITDANYLSYLEGAIAEVDDDE